MISKQVCKNYDSCQGACQSINFVENQSNNEQNGPGKPLLYFSRCEKYVESVYYFYCSWSYLERFLARPLLPVFVLLETVVKSIGSLSDFLSNILQTIVANKWHLLQRAMTVVSVKCHSDYSAA